MSGLMPLFLIYTAAMILHLAWLFALGLRVYGVRSSVVSVIFFELRPFVPALATTMYVCAAVRDHWAFDAVRIFNLLLGLLLWWYGRRDKDDDDRWKRRRKKLAERVAAVGGRLQVVPAGGSG